MPNIISTVGMSREEWLEARRNFLGASEIGTALGLNDYQTAFDLWRDKIKDPTYVPFQGNDRTKWGNRLEDTIAQGFAEDYGYKIQKDNKIRIHDNGIQSCSLDRVIVGAPGKNTPGILEIKNMGDYAYQKMLKDDNDIPLFYYSQHQQQFAITGYEWGYFVMLVGGNQLEVKEMFPDPDYIKRLENEAVEWWNSFVVAKVPPPFVIKDLKNPDSVTFSPTSKVVEQTFFNDVYEKYQKISAQITDLTKVKDQLNELIGEELSTNQNLEYMGCKIANWRDEKWFDSKKFQDENKDLYAKYKTKVIRKLIINKFKYEDKESA